MGSLSNLYISQSYQSLIHLGTNNTASANLIELQDGLGNSIGVAVNTNGDLFLSGSLTASLQQGYLYVGDSTGKTTAFATSSLVTNINTGSFVTTSSFNAYTQSNDQKVNSLISATGSYATTGANTFNGSQTINGEISASGYIYGNFVATNVGVRAPYIEAGPSKELELIGDIMTNKGVSITNGLSVTGSLRVTQTFTASLQEGYVWVGDASGKTTTVATSSLVTNINTGSLVTTASFNSYTQSTNIRLDNLESTSASVNISISNLNSTTASQAISITNLNSATSSYVTESETASFARTNVDNNFSANQTFTNITATSASITYLTTLYETASVIYSSGSNQLGDELTDVQTLSGSVKVQGSLTVNGIPVLTSSVDISGLVTTASFNAYTQSNDQKVSSLETNSASVNTSITNINSTTQSLNTSVSNLNQFTASQSTASIVNSITELNTFSASALVSISNLNASSASQQISIDNLNTNSASVNTSITNINSATASLFTSTSLSLVTASFNNGTRDLTFTKGDNTTFAVNIPNVSGSTINTGSFVTTSSFNAYTQSNDQRVSSLETNSASVNTSISNINQFTQSANISINALNAATSSYVTSAITSSSLITASVSLNTITFTKGDGTTFPITVNTGSGGGGSIDTGSLMVTGSVAGNILTFTKGDASTFSLTVATGSGGGGGSVDTGSLLVTASFASTNITFTKGDATTFNLPGFATTGSNTFNGNQTINGTDADALIVNGYINGKNISGTPYTYLQLFATNPSGIGSGVVLDANGTEAFLLDNGTFRKGITFRNSDLSENIFAVSTGSGAPFEFYRNLIVSGNVDIQSTLTASLQQGYAWVGDSNNRTTLVATSSFGSGGSIDTGSFATTGSNTFYGSQTISGSVLPLNNFGGNLGGSGQNWTNLYVNEIQGLSNLRVDTIKFNGVTLPLASSQPRQFFGNGIDASTAMYYATSSANVNALRELAYVQSGSPTTPDMNILSASFASTISSIVTGTGFATTGSNTFYGNQIISGAVDISNSFTASLLQGYTFVGDANNRTKLVATSSFGGGGTTYINPTLNPYSGSLILVANTFTSSSFAHISASANGQVNLVFKNNNNTADTVISGSGNIFTNAAAPTAGFKRYLTAGNLFLSTALPQISASMQYSPAISNNVGAGGAITIRGPVSSSLTQVNTNVLAGGTINIGSSATTHAQGLIGQTSVSNNIIAGQFNVIANQSNITALSNITQNNINGIVTLNLSSSATILSGNSINDSNFVFTNQFSSGAVGNGQISLSSNTIAGGGNQLYVTGSQLGAGNSPTMNHNLLSGFTNTLFVNASESRVSGSNIYQNALSTGIIGQRLIVTGSSNTNDAGSFGSVFVGRNNANDGIRNKTSDIVFAVGTGVSSSVAARKTGFLIDSGSNTFVEGTFNVSGSTTLSGSLYIQSGSTLPSATGSSILTWNPTTGQVSQSPIATLISSSFSVGAFNSTITQSGSAAVSQSMTFNNTDISNGVSIVSNSQITLANTGTYNIQFSAQINAPTGADTIWIWLKKNGTNVSNTATKLVLANNEANVAAWNFVVPATASDYFELVWQNNGGHAELLTEAAAGNYPAIPSIILTVTQVE